jgi:hypothetical protein
MRKKEVYKTKELPHVWVNLPLGSYDSGRAPGNSNISFHGDKFYSYSTVIAEKVAVPDRQEGEPEFVIFMTSRSYSMTTQRHKTGIWRAAGDVPVFYCGDSGIGNLDIEEKAYQNALGNATVYQAKAVNPRTKERNKGFYARSSEDQFKIAIQINQLFKLGHDTSTLMVAVAKLEEENAAAAKRHEERQQKLREERMAAEAKDLQRWMNGEDIYRSFDNSPVRCRVELGGCQEETPELVTSLGARVPLKEAERLYHWTKKYRPEPSSEGATVDFGTMFSEHTSVGHYRLDQLNEKGLKIGCHFIEWAEVDRIAKLCGWDQPEEVAKRCYFPPNGFPPSQAFTIWTEDDFGKRWTLAV